MTEIVQFIVVILMAVSVAFLVLGSFHHSKGIRNLCSAIESLSDRVIRLERKM